MFFLLPLTFSAPTTELLYTTYLSCRVTLEPRVTVFSMIVHVYASYRYTGIRFKCAFIFLYSHDANHKISTDKIVSVILITRNMLLGLIPLGAEDQNNTVVQVQPESSLSRRKNGTTREAHSRGPHQIDDAT
jgi:hypothetical protein